MDTAVDTSPRRTVVTPAIADVPVVDEGQSPWVVDVASGRVVRRPDCDPGETAPRQRPTRS